MWKELEKGRFDAQFASQNASKNSNKSTAFFQPKWTRYRQFKVKQELQTFIIMGQEREA